MDKRVFFPLLLLLYICMGLAACHKSKKHSRKQRKVLRRKWVFSKYSRKAWISVKACRRVFKPIKLQKFVLKWAGLFTQGSEVKAGQALFKINSATFQANEHSSITDCTLSLCRTASDQYHCHISRRDTTNAEWQCDFFNWRWNYIFTSFIRF